MTISLSPETLRLIEERMRQTGLSTADDVVQLALQTLAEVEGEGFEELDPQTRAAIDEAEAQFGRGEGVPLDEAFARLCEKHLGR